MPDNSALLGLPYLLPAQAQKHVTHNEALQLLDMLVQTSLAAIGSETPPATPDEGEMHALGDAPTGAWAGQAGRIAGFMNGAWTFLSPRPGWRAWDRAAGELRIWDGSAWVRPAGSETVARLGINTGADGVNRLAVASAATLFTHAGAGHQMKLNKAGAGDTASVLFQSGFTGHAEMGLAGDTDFSVKVSPDGSAWTTAMQVDAISGAAGFPEGVTLGGGNLLDTYEQGSWTPEAADAESGGNGASAVTATGRYTRIGEQVHVVFTLEGIDTTGLTGGNTLYLRGLPFAARNHASSHFTGGALLSQVSFASQPRLYLAAGKAEMRLMRNVSGGGPTALDVSALASGSADISGNLVYRV